MREHPEAAQNTQHAARPHWGFIFKIVKGELSRYKVIVDLCICRIGRTMGFGFCPSGQSTGDGVLAYRRCIDASAIYSCQFSTSNFVEFNFIK